MLGEIIGHQNFQSAGKFQRKQRGERKQSFFDFPPGLLEEVFQFFFINVEKELGKIQGLKFLQFS